jgi:flagellar basal-body rod protein FlgF
MPYGLYMSAAGAETQSWRMQVLSNNLANVDTTGFKRELAIPQARAAEAIEQGLVSADQADRNNIGGGVSIRETITEHAVGNFRDTGRTTDMALANNEHFFAVQGDDELLLTRSGNFDFDGSGVLRTQQGKEVLGTGGPIVADPTLPVTIMPDGRILQNNAEINRVRIEQPTSLGDLVRLGGNAFRSLAETNTVAQADTQIMSGFVETSAVSPTTEMMDLIETSRAYEANIKMIQNQDHITGELLSRVMRQA